MPNDNNSSPATNDPLFCDWLHWELWKLCSDKPRTLISLVWCGYFTFYADGLLHNIIGYRQDSGFTPRKYVVRLYIEPRYKQIRITNRVGSFLEVKLLLNFPHSNILGQGHNGLLNKHERGIKSLWISSLALIIWLGANRRSDVVSANRIPGEEDISTDVM